VRHEPVFLKELATLALPRLQTKMFATFSPCVSKSGFDLSIKLASYFCDYYFECFHFRHICKGLEILGYSNLEM